MVNAAGRRPFQLSIIMKTLSFLIVAIMAVLFILAMAIVIVGALYDRCRSRRNMREIAKRYFKN